MKNNIKTSLVHFVSIGLLAMFVTIAGFQANAADNIQETKDIIEFTIGNNQYTVNEAVYTMDTVPYTKNDRTMVPLRFLGNALGINNDNIKWENGTNKATLTKDNKTLEFTIGNSNYKVNDQAKLMDGGLTKPELDANDRVNLPARFIAEEFGYTVSWNGAKQKVIITRGVSQDEINILTGNTEATSENISDSNNEYAGINSNKPKIVQYLDSVIGGDYMKQDTSEMHNIWKATVNSVEYEYAMSEAYGNEIVINYNLAKAPDTELTKLITILNNYVPDYTQGIMNYFRFLRNGIEGAADCQPSSFGDMTGKGTWGTIHVNNQRDTVYIAIFNIPEPA